MVNIINTQFLTKEQVSGKLGISIATLNRYVEQGKIEPVRMGKFVKFKSEDVDVFINSLKIELPQNSI